MLPKKCPNCQKTIPYESKFCMYCAEPVGNIKTKRIEKILHHLQNDKPTEKVLFKLTNEFNKNWEDIRENTYLTHYLIEVMKEIRNPTNPKYLIHRSGGDSRSGGTFEDAFAQLLERYFHADEDFWEEGNFQLKVKVNKAIPVPGQRNKRRPDILIRHKSDKKPLILMELKTRFTKRSLIRTFNELESMYKQLSSDLEYYFIIFTASQQKAKTYKQASSNCKVLCFDFKPDKDSQIKGIQPKIIDPLEELFEEVKTVVKDKISLL